MVSDLCIPGEAVPIDCNGIRIRLTDTASTRGFGKRLNVLPSLVRIQIVQVEGVVAAINN